MLPNVKLETFIYLFANFSRRQATVQNSLALSPANWTNLKIDFIIISAIVRGG